MRGSVKGVKRGPYKNAGIKRGPKKSAWLTFLNRLETTHKTKPVSEWDEYDLLGYVHAQVYTQSGHTMPMKQVHLVEHYDLAHASNPTKHPEIYLMRELIAAIHGKKFFKGIKYKTWNPEQVKSYLDWAMKFTKYETQDTIKHMVSSRMVHMWRNPLPAKMQSKKIDRTTLTPASVLALLPSDIDGSTLGNLAFYMSMVDCDPNPITIEVIAELSEHGIDLKEIV